MKLFVVILLLTLISSSFAGHLSKDKKGRAKKSHESDSSEEVEVTTSPTHGKNRKNGGKGTTVKVISQSKQQETSRSQENQIISEKIGSKGSNLRKNGTSHAEVGGKGTTGSQGGHSIGTTGSSIGRGAGQGDSGIQEPGIGQNATSQNQESGGNQGELGGISVNGGEAGNHSLGITNGSQIVGVSGSQGSHRNLGEIVEKTKFTATFTVPTSTLTTTTSFNKTTPLTTPSIAKPYGVLGIHYNQGTSNVETSRHQANPIGSIQEHQIGAISGNQGTHTGGVAVAGTANGLHNVTGQTNQKTNSTTPSTATITPSTDSHGVFRSQGSGNQEAHNSSGVTIASTANNLHRETNTGQTGQKTTFSTPSTPTITPFTTSHGVFRGKEAFDNTMQGSPNVETLGGAKHQTNHTLTGDPHKEVNTGKTGNNASTISSSTTSIPTITSPTVSNATISNHINQGASGNITKGNPNVGGSSHQTNHTLSNAAGGGHHKETNTGKTSAHSITPSTTPSTTTFTSTTPASTALTPEVRSPDSDSSSSETTFATVQTSVLDQSTAGTTEMFFF